MSLVANPLLAFPGLLSGPPPEVRAVLIALAYLLFKHAIADYFLQTRYQWFNKGQYGHLGGVVHSGLHVLLTVPVFFILPGASLTLAAVLLAAEFLIHYHVDWVKDSVVRARGWTSADDGYWRAMGADQLVHGLTYVAIVWILSSA
jgi:hypothetical protein